MGNYEQVKKSRHLLKERLVDISGGKCCICGYNKCLQALEFHHIDPSQKDFTISQNTNMGFEKAIQEIKKCILVCANCHREIHAGLIVPPQQNYFNEQKYQEILAQRAPKKNYCIDCGKEISLKALRCPCCSNQSKRQAIRPDKEELKKMIRNQTFLSIGQKYNVSDNAVRKWCKQYGLPYRVKDIKQYSNEEWDKI